MTTTMIHLLAAREWAAGRAMYEGSPEFFLGAISPDAVHARAHVEKADKQKSHLGNHGKPNFDALAEYIAERQTAFDIGYIVHLISDPIWCAKYRRELPGLFGADGHTIPALYYPDCANVEAELCDQGLLDLIERATAPSDNPLLCAGDISKWRDMVVAQYREPERDARGRGIITREFVLDFVSEVAESTDEIMRRLNYEPCSKGNNGPQEHARV